MFGQTQKHRLDQVGAMIKRTKGVLLGWVLHNSGYGEQSVLFFDRNYLPDGADPVDWRLMLAPGETSTAEFAMGIPFYNGISYLQTGAITGVLLYA